MQDEPFLEYAPGNLACIIVGSKMNENVRTHFLNNLNVNVPIYTSRMGYRSFRINLLPLEYKIEYDGSTIPFICTTDKLIESIESKNL